MNSRETKWKEKKDAKCIDSFSFIKSTATELGWLLAYFSSIQSKFHLEDVIFTIKRDYYNLNLAYSSRIFLKANVI